MKLYFRLLYLVFVIVFGFLGILSFAILMKKMELVEYNQYGLFLYFILSAVVFLWNFKILKFYYSLKYNKKTITLPGKNLLFFISSLYSLWAILFVVFGVSFFVDIESVFRVEIMSFILFRRYSISIVFIVIGLLFNYDSVYMSIQMNGFRQNGEGVIANKRALIRLIIIIVAAISYIIMYKIELKPWKEVIVKRYENGNMMEARIYHNKQDTTVYDSYKYFQNGNVENEIKAKNAYEIDEAYVYYPNGNKKASIKYSNNNDEFSLNPDELFNFYNENGALVEVVALRGSDTTAVITFDIDGKIIENIRTKDNYDQKLLNALYK